MRTPTFWPTELVVPITDELKKHDQDADSEAFLLCTFDMYGPMLHTSVSDPPWSTRPSGELDAFEYKICSKTGLKVPKHAQATYMRKVYDRRYVPEGPHDRARSNF